MIQEPIDQSQILYTPDVITATYALTHCPRNALKDFQILQQILICGNIDTKNYTMRCNVLTP